MVIRCATAVIVVAPSQAGKVRLRGIIEWN